MIRNLLAASALVAAASTTAAADPVCDIMASVGYAADQMRQDGVPLRQAERAIGSMIGTALSDQPGSLRARQGFADWTADFGEFITGFVYSRPIASTAEKRYFSPQTTSMAIEAACLRGDL